MIDSPSVAILRRSCLHHPEREAAGRCPECRQTFCRECLTDHDGRVICATCLAQLRSAAPERSRGAVTAALLRVSAAAAGIALACLFYFTLGKILLSIPHPFHQGRWYFTGEQAD